jgi:hypothetical protein
LIGKQNVKRKNAFTLYNCIMNNHKHNNDKRDEISRRPPAADAKVICMNRLKRISRSCFDIGIYCLVVVLKFIRIYSLGIHKIYVRTEFPLWCPRGLIYYFIYFIFPFFCWAASLQCLSLDFTMMEGGIRYTKRMSTNN